MQLQDDHVCSHIMEMETKLGAWVEGDGKRAYKHAC